MYENLFQKVKSGDKKSFELLFKAFYAPLCLYSGKFIPDKDECEEIVQSFFTKLWDKREQIEINTSVKNYLFGSVRNMCFNHLKHMKIRNNYNNHVIRDDQRGSDYHDVFLEVDLVERIEAAIASLPDRRREIFLLNREHGLKYREIADHLSLSVKTVETQMGQALKTLRDKLKEYQTILVGFFVFVRS